MAEDRRPIGLADYARLTVDDVRDAVDEGLAGADQALAGASPGTGLAVLDAISDAARCVWTAYGRSAFLAAVHPDGAVRDAADDASQRISRWRSRLLRDPGVFAALEGIDPASLDVEARAVRSRWIGAMRRAGAELGDAERVELDALGARVAALQATFMANQAGDRATIEVDAARLDGLPASIRAGLDPGRSAGTVVVPIELRQTILERVADRGVREAIQRRWFEVAAAANRPVLEELIATHRRLAEILGFGSWSAARAADGTLGDLDAVDRFLDELEGPFLAARDDQLDAIRRPLATEMGIDAETMVLEDWDVARGLALLRDEFGADGSALREAFPLDGVLAGLGRCVERVFGVRVTERSDVGGWHPSVRRLDLTDAASGRAIGSILLDLFAREGKVTGLAGMCDILHFGGVDREGERRPTHTAIVLFLSAPSAGPVLMAPTDIEALFHELGHALDFILGNPRFAPIDTDGWIADWSEAPSQSVGRWAALPEVLAELGRDPATGGPLDLERIRGAARAAEAGMALQNLRFLWFARLDQALHGSAAVDLDEAWRQAWPIRGTAPSIDRFLPGPLMIIALGYDGVMYGFLWAQALLEEIVARFRDEGPLSDGVGGAYRRELLEPGWAPDPIDRMRRFLGRDPSIGPYVGYLTGSDPTAARPTGARLDT
jgi:Zn-dependent oligopeptidase